VLATRCVEVKSVCCLCGLQRLAAHGTTLVVVIVRCRSIVRRRWTRQGEPLPCIAQALSAVCCLIDDPTGVDSRRDGGRPRVRRILSPVTLAVSSSTSSIAARAASTSVGHLSSADGTLHSIAVPILRSPTAPSLQMRSVS